MMVVISQNGHEIKHELPCPCCGQLTRRFWVQPALLPGREPHGQTDCINPDCVAYYVTLSPVQFEQRFGVTLEES